MQLKFIIPTRAMFNDKTWCRGDPYCWTDLYRAFSEQSIFEKYSQGKWTIYNKQWKDEKWPYEMS